MRTYVNTMVYLAIKKDNVLIILTMVFHYFFSMYNDAELNAELAWTGLILVAKWESLPKF